MNEDDTDECDDSKNKNICKACGRDYGSHRFGTLACPVGGGNGFSKDQKFTEESKLDAL